MNESDHSGYARVLNGDDEDSAVGLGLDQAKRKQLEKAAEHLVDHKSIRLRQGVLNGKRVGYFKGKYAISALSEPAASQHLLAAPKDASATTTVIEDETEPKKSKKTQVPATVMVTLEAMVLQGLLLRVDKTSKSKHLSMTPLQSFDASEYFVLVHQKTSYYHLLGSIGLVAVVLAGVMFPVWPYSLRVGVMYLSYVFLGLMGLLIGLGVLRLIIYLILCVVGKPGWLFPNLFADVGILESFQPVWQWANSTSAPTASTEN